jgi:DNA-binding transcriptional LysR family regulator
MDRFHAIQVFTKVADCGGFTAAARVLAMSPPAVTRAIAQLEDHLGTRLFVRTTRSVRLTETGERFLVDGRRILLDLEEAEEAAVGSHAAPRGMLNITAPVLFGRLYVSPVLGDFLGIHPNVNARTLYVDRNVNLMDEGLDVAIRIGELADSSMIAVRAGTVRRVLFASPGYLAEQGTPQHLRDLNKHRLIQSTAVSAAPEWKFEESGSPVSLPIKPRLCMNTNDAVIELALRDWGMSQLLSYQIASHVAAGQLQCVLEGFELPALPIHVVHQEGRLVSAKVRAFVDFMVDRLRADVTLN